MNSLGELARLDAIEDESSRFYAYIGRCVSVFAEIEFFLFLCYLSASGLDEKEATRIFYEDISFPKKRKLAFRTVGKLFPNDGSVLEEWDKIYSKIEDLCGENNARNLISHNGLAADLFVHREDEEVPPFIRLVVAQNRYLVEHKDKKPKLETLESLRLYVGELLGVLWQLMDFRQMWLVTQDKG